MRSRELKLAMVALALSSCTAQPGTPFAQPGVGDSGTQDEDADSGTGDPSSSTSTTNPTTGISASATTGATISATDPDTGNDTACATPDDCDDLDGDPCTWPVCGEDGTCSELAADCEGQNNTCAVAMCNPRTGACEYLANDDNCADAASCEVSSCELTLDENGLLLEASCQTEALDGVACDDEDNCTQDDTCTRGVCSGQDVACDTPPPSACDGDTIQTFSGGACTDRGCVYDVAEFACPDGCAQSVCQGPDHPLISEVLYDSDGDDTNVWIELWAPPGSSLNNVVIEAVNGNGGTVYGSLALSGTTPADGIVLIVFGSATDPALTGAADFTDPIADLQNGPDGLRIVQGGAQVDALGYGNVSGSQVFAGEGSPTPDASPDRSVARSLSVIDTDDNSADFSVEVMPTPGAINPG